MQRNVAQACEILVLFLSGATGLAACGEPAISSPIPGKRSPYLPCVASSLVSSYQSPGPFYFLLGTTARVVFRCSLDPVGSVGSACATQNSLSGNRKLGLEKR